MVIESQIIAVISGSVSIVVSYLIYPAVATQFGAPYGIQPPSYPWNYAALGIAVGMLTALLGSLAPAIYSLNVRISNIMRG